MTRLALLLLLFVVVGVALRVVVRAALEALVGTSSRPPVGGVPMVRDPVCGTFVVRERALMLGGSSGTLYFCSARCRDEYQSSRRHPGREGRLA
jgi:YHS domain-containing protein